jgi:cbb3-type cytochrome oxidase subunit 3
VESVQTWEIILLGAIALLVILWFRPGIKAAFERSRHAEKKDWQGALIPLVVVMLFVIFLLWVI